MISVIILTLYDNAVAVNLDLLSIGDYRDAEMLGDLGSYLCGMIILMIVIEIFSTKVRTRLARG